MKYPFDPIMYQTVAKNIRKYREIKNMSLSDLAKYAKIDEEFLIEFENNKNISLEIYDLYKISVILDVNINCFFE